MPKFHYLASDSTGDSHEGQLEARSSIDAVNQLRRQGLKIERLLEQTEVTARQPAVAVATQAPVAVSADSVWHTILEPADAQASEAHQPSEMPIGAEDLAALAGRIAQITRSQLPLTPGLRALSQELPSRSMRRSMENLCQRLERGEPPETALGGENRAVPGHISGLIVLGIRTGRLGEIMEWFLHHVRRQIDLRRRCRAALIYPVALLTCGLLAAVGGLIFIVPDMVAIYSSGGLTGSVDDLPVIELLDIASTVLRTYGYWILAGLLTVIAGVPLLLYAFGGKVLLHRCLAGIPFIGMMFRCSGLAAFCELLATLGCEVEVAAALDGLVDATYIRDPGLVTQRGGVVFQMAKPARRDDLGQHRGAGRAEEAVRTAVPAGQAEQQAERRRPGQQRAGQGRGHHGADRQRGGQDPASREPVAGHAAGQREQQRDPALRGEDKAEAAGRAGDPQDGEAQRDRQGGVGGARGDEGDGEPPEPAIGQQAGVISPALVQHAPSPAPGQTETGPYRPTRR